jgi:tetratricopeptide (TPR) repeat protein
VIALLTDVIDPNANQRYRLASAYEAVGDVESALQWYQSYPDLDLNAPNQLGWRAASLLRMSALYEQLGDTQSARTRREEFLRLWGDADLDVQPVVDSVRSSLGSAPVRSARSSRQ